MSEPILDKENDDSNDYDNDSSVKKSDFVRIGGNVLGSINLKMAFFLFLLGMLIFSDVFIDGILSKMDGNVQGECTTTKGTLIQLLLLCLSYIVLDLFTKAGWL